MINKREDVKFLLNLLNATDFLKEGVENIMAVLSKHFSYKEDYSKWKN